MWSCSKLFHVQFHRGRRWSRYWTVLCSIWWGMSQDLHPYLFSWICGPHGRSTPVRLQMEHFCFYFIYHTPCSKSCRVLSLRHMSYIEKCRAEWAAAASSLNMSWFYTETGETDVGLVCLLCVSWTFSLCFQLWGRNHWDQWHGGL